jgi:hypothetical protein
MAKERKDTGFTDKKGNSIYVGDKGYYRDMMFNIIEINEGFTNHEFRLEKWCQLYTLPLDEASAKIFEVDNNAKDHNRWR